VETKNAEGRLGYPRRPPSTSFRRWIPPPLGALPRVPEIFREAPTKMLRLTGCGRNWPASERTNDHATFHLEGGDGRRLGSIAVHDAIPD
jgi:hypothetical protein